jgi:putative FmdB family regulatory protein
VPVYEYWCPDCAELTEELRKIEERDHPMSCPCGGSGVRQVSHTSFQLKGGGWYADGYQKGKA